MILNRFFKPKWQHPNPQIRKQALQELSFSDPILAQIAQQDRHPDVRRAALERITLLDLLQQIAVQDTDTAVQAAAEARFRDLMTGKALGSPPIKLRLAVLSTLSAERLEFLAVAAKEPELRLAALAHTKQEVLLSKVATTDPVVEVRLAALSQVNEISIVENIAKQSRNRDKRVYRKAQERLDRWRAEQAQAVQLEQLCSEIEQLTWDGETGLNAARFLKLEKAWQAVESAADVGLRERYEQARTKFLALRQESTAKRMARLNICMTLENYLASLEHETELTIPIRTKLAATLEDGQTHWQRCGTTDDSEGRRLEQRFEQLIQALHDREHLLYRNHERAERLREVLQQATTLLNQASEVLEADLTALQKRWTALERPETPDLAGQLQNEFDVMQGKLRARLQRQVELRDQEWAELQKRVEDVERALADGELQQAIALHEQARQHLQQNIGLSRKQMHALDNRLRACLPKLSELRGWRRWGTNLAREHLCEDAERLIGIPVDPLYLAQQIKEIRAAWKTLDSAEGAASKALWMRFDRACEKAYQPCQLYFEAQTRERQANLAKKQALCERLEQLETNTDWNKVDWRRMDRTFRDIQKEWHKIGPVNRTDQETLAQRYNTALKRLDSHLQKERERELHRRQKLIQHVQELVQSTDVQAAIDGAKQAQAAWQPTVQSSRRNEQALWRQFRAACDAAFACRQAEQKAAAEERQANLARKTTLCEEIEALAGVDETGIQQALRQVQQAQETWEAIGPVPKTVHRNLEQRFAAACHQVSLREQELHQAKVLEERENLRNRAKLCAFLEAFLWQVMPTNTETIVTQAHQDWETLPPLPSALAEAIQQRFATICEALLAGEENCRILRQTLEDNIKKKQHLCIRMEVAAGIESPPEFAQARMAYQVVRLSESLHNRDAAKATANRLEEAFHIEQEWHLLGISPPAQEEGLEKRFQQALAAFLGTK